MPKDVTHFDHMDGIWVSSLGCILPIADVLRVSVIELAGVRRSSEGQLTRAVGIYGAVPLRTEKRRRLPQR